MFREAATARDKTRNCNCRAVGDHLASALERDARTLDCLSIKKPIAEFM
jgi:hypothetical protein